MVPRGSPGLSPLSHTSRTPLDLSLWRQSREANSKSLAHAVYKHCWARVFFTSIFPLIILFYHFPFTQLLLSVVQTFCTSFISIGLCKVPLLYVIWIQPLNLRLQIWPLQRKGDFGSVLIVHHGCHPSRMTTILYALNAESRYVT